MKTLIVIDMPDDTKLDEWFAKIQLDRMRVPISEMYGVIFDETKVLNFVPLRPMPQEMDIDDFPNLSEEEYVKVRNYVGGWNDCIDEITGETE